MKRKIYTTARERKIDQIIGFVACLFLNAALWFVTNRLQAWAAVTFLGPSYNQARTWILLTPWIVNGIIIVLAFLFRPEMGVGYIMCAAALCVPVIGSVLLLVACFMAFTVGSILPNTVIFVLVFFGTLAGMLWLGWQVLAWVIRRWRRDETQNLHDGP